MHLSSSLSSLYNLFSPLKLPVRGRNNSRQGLEPAGDPKASGQPIPNYYYSEGSPGQFHKKRLRGNPHIAHLRSTYYAASLILTLNFPFYTLPTPPSLHKLLKLDSSFSSARTITTQTQQLLGEGAPAHLQEQFTWQGKTISRRELLEGLPARFTPSQCEIRAPTLKDTCDAETMAIRTTAHSPPFLCLVYSPLSLLYLIPSATSFPLSSPCNFLSCHIARQVMQPYQPLRQHYCHRIGCPPHPRTTHGTT